MKNFIIKCPYGNHKISVESTLFSQCKDCHASLTLNSDLSIKDVIWFPSNGYYNLWIDFAENKTYLYDRRSVDIVMVLNYAVTATTDNVDEWINRLLNLKAFS